MDSYKEKLQECVEFLCGMRDRELDAPDGSLEKYEALDEYGRAIGSALQVIAYYEEREAIIKAQQGDDIVKQIDTDWYQLKIAKINEAFGIGFGDGTGNEED